METPIICIGSVLWDVIGRTQTHSGLGGDVAGFIKEQAGGVAFNIAKLFSRKGCDTIMLSHIGKDPAGCALLEVMAGLGIDGKFAYRSANLPTDRYMAIEDATGLIAALADANSLEAAGEAILRPLSDGRLGSPIAPFKGTMVVDGNLTETLLARIAQDPLLQQGDLRICSASPGKATRLRCFLGGARVTIYCNKHEAEFICASEFATAADAALALTAAGAWRAIVTDGVKPAADVQRGQPLIVARPAKVQIKQITGAGDVFMAQHILAELDGAPPEEALKSAIGEAQNFVAGKI